MPWEVALEKAKRQKKKEPKGLFTRARRMPGAKPVKSFPKLIHLDILFYFFLFYLLLLLFFVFLLFLWAAPTAYGGSQARGLIGAVATGLHQGHSSAGSKPRMQHTPQLTATPDP